MTDEVKSTAKPIINAMTVDVEDYFQVSAFERVIDRNSWSHIEPRVERNTEQLLGLFDQYDTKATFFILGWIAERFPALVKTIAEQGHEVASHGYAHKRAYAQTEGDFRRDVDRTRKLLQDLTGLQVIGYRAPSFSITRNNEWAYDVLAEVGHRYSSSVYPVAHDHYGIPDAPRFSYQTRQGMQEVPLSTLAMGNKNIPISGGGYFRLYPYPVSAWAIQRLHAVDQQPYIFYMHPWEIDPAQPRQKGIPLKTRFRHYLNLNKFYGRLENLLQDFQWGAMGQLLSDQQVDNYSRDETKLHRVS